MSINHKEKITIAILDEINRDAESDHADADEAILSLIKSFHPEVYDAYVRCQNRAGGWWFA